MAHKVLFLGPAHVHGKKTAVALWVVIGLASLLFVFAGAGKLLNPAMTRANFERWLYPEWFGYVVGVGELLAGLLLWVPQVRFWVASGLVLEMLGALFTHVRIAEWSMVFAPLLPLALALIIVGLDRPERLRRTKTPGPDTAQT